MLVFKGFYMFVLYLMNCLISLTVDNLLISMLFFMIHSILFFKLMSYVLEFELSSFATKYFLQDIFLNILLLLGLFIQDYYLVFMMLLSKIPVTPFECFLLESITHLSFESLTLFLVFHKLYVIFYILSMVDILWMGTYMKIFMFFLVILNLLKFLTCTTIKQAIIYSSLNTAVWVCLFSFYYHFTGWFYLLQSLMLMMFMYYTIFWDSVKSTNLIYVVILSGIPPANLWMLKIISMPSFCNTQMLYMLILLAISSVIYYSVFKLFFSMAFITVSDYKKYFFLHMFFLIFIFII